MDAANVPIFKSNIFLYQFLLRPQITLGYLDSNKFVSRSGSWSSKALYSKKNCDRTFENHLIRLRWLEKNQYLIFITLWWWLDRLQLTYDILDHSNVRPLSWWKAPRAQIYNCHKYVYFYKKFLHIPLKLPTYMMMWKPPEKNCTTSGQDCTRR